MRSAFPGFPAEAMTFYRGLARNNTREWFQPRKPVYDEQVKAPMVELVTALNQAMMKFAPDYVTDPAKAIYRIYRDTRFSPDKTPYKTQIAASFARRGMEKHGAAGFISRSRIRAWTWAAASTGLRRRRCWRFACISVTGRRSSTASVHRRL
jgi:uncharacterized protein (TIGR02453 family)